MHDKETVLQCILRVNISQVIVHDSIEDAGNEKKVGYTDA